MFLICPLKIVKYRMEILSSLKQPLLMKSSKISKFPVPLSFSVSNSILKKNLQYPIIFAAGYTVGEVLEYIK